MKFIPTDAHCVKISKLDLENKKALLRFSWIPHTHYTLNVVGYSESGDLILEPVFQRKEKVQYHVQPEKGQIKTQEWLNVVTKVVTA